jgi:hypothetical protein
MDWKTILSQQRCLIQDCGNRIYAPGGKSALCRDHFLEYVKWRRKRGLAMFTKYAAMTMDERDLIVSEWSKTVKVE